MPHEVMEAVAASLAEWQEISVAEHLGEAAFRSAEWMPFDQSIFSLFYSFQHAHSHNFRVPHEVAKPMKNKNIVESKDISKLGIQEKAFKPDNVIVIDDTWHHICKPMDGKPKCVILWGHDNPQDTNPTEKIVSIFYGKHFWC